MQIEGQGTVAMSAMTQIVSLLQAQPELERGHGGMGSLSVSIGSVDVLALLILVLQIALVIWVARDAKARGMNGPVIWMLIVFLMPVIGLLAYVFARPQGQT